MKPKVAISIGLSLMLTTAGWEFGSNRISMMPVAVAVSGKVSNGQIIQISGDVQLMRSPDRVIHPKTGTRLYPGDTVRTASGSQVLIQCGDLTIRSVLAGKNQMNDCQQPTEQQECSPGIDHCPHRGDIAWNDNIPYIISPRRTAILNNKPILRWNPVPGATSYTVSIDEDGREIWKTNVRSTEVLYPSTPPLKPGSDYMLHVETDTDSSSFSSDEEPVIPGKQGFSLLNNNQAQQIQAQAKQIAQQQWTSQAKALALANLYIKNGLIEDAIATLEKLVDSGVQTAPIYRSLGDLYLYYLVLVPQAGVYYSKAVQLVDPKDAEEQTAVQDGLKRVQKALGEEASQSKLLTDLKSGAIQTKPAYAGFKRVRAGGLRFCSRDFQSPDTFAQKKMGNGML